MTEQRISEKIDFKTIVKIAIPVMFGIFVQNAVLIIDNIFLSKISETAFNAGGNGGLFYFTIFMLGMGYASGLQIIIARKIGERNPEKIGEIFLQGIYFLTTLGVLIFLFILFFSDIIIENIFTSTTLANQTYRFLSIRSLGFIFSFIYLVFMGFYLGKAQTKIIFISSTLIASLNLLLDYILIFGHLGAPKLGLEGAALASVISEAAGLILILTYFLTSTNRAQHGLTTLIGFRIKPTLATLSLSFPLMLQGFLSFAAWSVFFIIVERTGSFELSVSHIIRNMYNFAIIPLFGFNAVTKTIVSNLMGQNKIHLLWKPIKKVVLLSLAFTLVFVHGNIFYPQEIIKVFTSDPDKILTGSQLLMLVTGVLLIFSVASVIFNAIAGTGKTKLSLLIEIAAILIYIFSAYLGSNAKNNQIFLIWSSEYLYFSVLGILSFFFLFRITHKKPNKIKISNFYQKNEYQT